MEHDDFIEASLLDETQFPAFLFDLPETQEESISHQTPDNPSRPLTTDQPALQPRPHMVASGSHGQPGALPSNTTSPHDNQHANPAIPTIPPESSSTSIPVPVDPCYRCYVRRRTCVRTKPDGTPFHVGNTLVCRTCSNVPGRRRRNPGSVYEACRPLTSTDKERLDRRCTRCHQSRIEQCSDTLPCPRCVSMQFVCISPDHAKRWRLRSI
ncbi:hypothetical protein BKA63DRAFT_119669 [Paraphoma chrysanthemicola]|nr:hypothetical protein BKA63DRAFT_119669 [Paraphoma chrysanthemicola]